MSMISIKNLAAPFTNKVHLTTMVLVALLFGIYRWSGGTIRVINRQTRSDFNHTESQSAVEKRQMRPAGELAAQSDLSALTRRTAASAPQNIGKSEDLLPDILGSKRNTGEKKERAASSFDDIEKSLGLK